MLLRFNHRYQSIMQFDAVDLPDLSVITGVNGSGKTHLLQAIQNRSVIVEGIDQNAVIMFSYENFRLDSEQIHNAQAINQERQNTYTLFDQQIRPNLRNFRNVLANDYAAIRQQAADRKIPFWNVPGFQPLQNYKTQVENFFRQHHLKDQPQFGALLSLIKSAPDALEDITAEDFDVVYKPITYKNDFLPQAIGRIIWDYNFKLTKNRANEFQNERYGLSLPFLGAEEFVAKNGEKPWLIINGILKQFNSLEYEIPSPEKLDFLGNYQLKLAHIDGPNLQIDFGGLSSGERVLMALVASVYKSASDNNFPDLLLLDELDATLHPSMMKNMLSVINNVFIARGTKVILVTHSPSTVAFAPKDAIFVMNKKSLNRIEKRSKKDALSILTEGFATLDDGMLLFDQVADGKYSIITEGKNTRLITAAFQHFGVDEVNVIAGVEDRSGKEQLKTLFQFMSKVPHKNHAIFVWDCDANYILSSQNHTHPIFLERNSANNLAKSGIENMFEENLFSGFIKSTTRAKGEVIEAFDESCKREFEDFIIQRNNPDDFKKFKSFVDAINSIKQTSD